jgi:hypothetical protein
VDQDGHSLEPWSPNHLFSVKAGFLANSPAPRLRLRPCSRSAEPGRYPRTFWTGDDKTRSTTSPRVSFPMTPARKPAASCFWKSCGSSSRSCLACSTTGHNSLAQNSPPRDLKKGTARRSGPSPCSSAKCPAVNLALLANLLSAVGFAGRIERFPSTLLPGSAPVTQVDGRLVQY